MTLVAASTHEAFNQTPPFVDVNLAALDAPLMGAVRAFGRAEDAHKLLAHGAAMGTAEAATAASLRLARAFDRMRDDPIEAAYARLLTPAIKFAVCKTAPAFLYEAMECLGGNGYIEESPLPRLYREAPVNAIWEGSGNIMALDTLRAAGGARQPTSSSSGPCPGASLGSKTRY
jgi:alkylation response protein AidB-like acyl-CoA dehydrogenase